MEELRQDAVVKMLTDACAAAGSARKFAEQHKLSPNYVSQVLRGGRPPSDDMAEALGLKPDGKRWVKTNGKGKASKPAKAKRAAKR